MNIVYTGGTFDLFHAGHVFFLKQCAKYGNVTVALNTDEFVERYKGKPPIMKYWEREVVLKSCLWVDNVVPNIGSENSKPAILSVKPDYIIIGDDWLNKDYPKQMGFTNDWLQENFIKLVYIPYSNGISTTEIKRRIAQ